MAHSPAVITERLSLVLACSSGSLAVALAMAAVVGACGSGTTTGGDGGAGTSGTSGSSSGSSGDASADAPSDASADAPSDGASSGSDGSALDRCTRTPSLDTACATAFGASAPNGYACSDVFMHPPPCQPLTSLGCTEVCSNRCCP